MNPARTSPAPTLHRGEPLCANDPDVVVETLNEAFADNEAPAACVGVHEARATIVVVAPDPDDVIPERMPSVTDAGNVSLRKMSKSDRNKYYSAVLYGHALVSSKEAFAVAPGLDSLAVIVVSRPGIDVYGERRRPNALVAATVRRAALNGVRWSEHGGDEILPQVADELVVNRKGRAATSIRSSSITSRRSPQLSTWSMPRSRSGTHRSFGAPVGVPERVDCSRHPGAHPVGGLSFAPVSGSSDDSDTMRFQQRAER